jgi:hypothetical protein
MPIGFAIVRSELAALYTRTFLISGYLVCTGKARGISYLVLICHSVLVEVRMGHTAHLCQTEHLPSKSVDPRLVGNVLIHRVRLKDE